MSSLPPSSTPPEGDDSAPVSLPAADAAPESSPAVADATQEPAAAVATASEPPTAPADGDAAEPQEAGAAGRPALEDAGPQLK